MTMGYFFSFKLTKIKWVRISKKTVYFVTQVWDKNNFSWSRKTLKSVLRGAIKQKRCINFLDSSRKVKILFLYQPLIRIILMYCLMYANVSLRYAYCSHPASQDYSKVIYPKYSKHWPYLLKTKKQIAAP